ncbi:MAG: hypothetical protein WBN82_04110, partial [Porticoccaceae bacterium]
HFHYRGSIIAAPAAGTPHAARQHTASARNCPRICSSPGIAGPSIAHADITLVSALSASIRF